MMNQRLYIGYLRPNGDPAFLLVFDFQYFPWDNNGYDSKFDIDFSFENVKFDTAPRVSALYFAPEYQQWKFSKPTSDKTGRYELYSMKDATHFFTATEKGFRFRSPILLECYDTHELSCRFWVSNSRFQYLSDAFTLKHSGEPTNNLRRYDVNNLASVAIPGLFSYRMDLPAPSKPEARPIGQRLEKGLLVDSLPKLETTNEWKSLHSYFAKLDAAEHKMPRHVWVSNNSKITINIVVSESSPMPNAKRAASVSANTVLFGPGIRKVLPPASSKSDNFSAAFPLWQSGGGFISAFDSEWKCHRTVPITNGARVRFDSLSKEVVRDGYEIDTKQFPLFPITINGNMHQLADDSILEANAKSKYILIQSYMPLIFEQKKALKQLGLYPLEYVSKNTYLYRRNNTSLEKLQQLSYVAYTGVYQKNYKFAGKLKDIFAATSEARPEDEWDVDVIFHDDVNTEALRDCIANIMGLKASAVILTKHKLRARVLGEHLANLASMDEVRVIEEVHKPTLRGNNARVILGIIQDGNPIQGGNPIYEGQGEIIAVADTGIDRGHMLNVHEAFGTATESRILSIHPFYMDHGTRTALVDDADGHGTHVCGLVLGDGKFKGAAPKAKLICQCLGPDVTGLPHDLTRLFQHAYDDGARVHNNSWGAEWDENQPPYGQAAEIDSFGLYIE
ncbi:hypothetical protein O1611_g9072 [Lasiodiplodia mahajangana]|uniref:Uncharacterized protein n=1 Tax=Lasiodiplodia mahajangana TaxID=1108764 RepID=A0ACC2JB28_9PEZI|nr:hypothetical protein O1611_g9072 [Lasiodiplodia mahajangana]